MVRLYICIKYYWIYHFLCSLKTNSSIPQFPLPPLPGPLTACPMFLSLQDVESHWRRVAMTCINIHLNKTFKKRLSFLSPLSLPEATILLLFHLSFNFQSHMLNFLRHINKYILEK